MTDHSRAKGKIITKALTQAEANYRNAMAEAERARMARIDVVLDAIDAGWTHAQIAAVLGVTRGRINQIAQS